MPISASTEVLGRALRRGRRSGYSKATPPSFTAGQTSLTEAATAFAGSLDQAATGEFRLDVETSPLADVEKNRTRSGGGRRIVFVP
ncbi:hypothetical protein AB0L00_13525 [Actinoallomurus sp. NPDC052308]|uniref:hypothetical protein n=1 Tax=Actinoallomurus sp. NPDC052308 TaxID=3155530 RepID=UPI00342A5A3E